MQVKDISTALASLLKGGASLAVIQQMVNDVSLTKAAANLSEAEKVLDKWQSSEIHAGASKEEIKTGPGAAASGDGAAKMVAHYSDTTTQHGTTQVAESLARLLGPINSSMKSLFEIVEKHDKIFAEMLKSMAPAAKSDEKKDEDSEEESEVVEINASKAKQHLRKAKRFVAKAEDAENNKDEKALLAKAAEQFALARGHARLAGDLTLDKSIKKDAMDAGIKADINVVQEDEEEEEADKSKKSDSMQDKDAEAKAKADEAAAAKAKEEAEAKAKAEEAAAKAGQKGAVSAEQLQAALSGIAMLETTVKGLMEVVSGSSKMGGGIPPSFVKSATAEQVSTIRDQIGEMADAGQLSDPDALASLEILDKMALVKSGHLDESVVTARVMKSSPAVKALFAKLAA